MKKILNFLLTIISISSTAQQTIINDKNAEVRNVSGFNAIKISGAMEVYLSQGSTEAVAVSASEDKYRDQIKTEVVNGTLKIYYDGNHISWNKDKMKLKAYVSVKNLNALESSGASQFMISGTLDFETLGLKLSGASELSGTLKITNLRLDLSGASDVKINGNVKNLNIEASGASDVKAYDLTAESCSVKLSGASDVKITVNSEITAHASGASSVKYKGNAVLKESHTSGASSISKKG